METKSIILSHNLALSIKIPVNTTWYKFIERNAFFSDGLEEINEEVERQDGVKVEKWDNVKGCVNV